MLHRTQIGSEPRSYHAPPGSTPIRQASLLVNTVLPAISAPLCPVLLRPASMVNTHSVAKQPAMTVLKATNAQVAAQKPLRNVLLALTRQLVRLAAASPAQMAKAATSCMTLLLIRALQALITKLDQKMD